MRSWLHRFGVGAFLFSCGFAGAVSANPLLYNVVANESDVNVSFQALEGMNVTPDFTGILGQDAFPHYSTVTGSSDTFPTNDSKVTADVGIPGGFDEGAHGITFSQMSIVTQDLPGTLEGFGLLPVPLDVLGTNVQFVAFFAHVSSFSIVLNAPFSSTLTPTGNLNEWLWSGLADVTISGEIKPLVQIPTQGDFPLGTFPFSQQATVPLFGTFSGDSTHTRVAVGLQQGALQNLDLSLPPINEQLDLLNLGLVTGLFQLSDLTLVDISTAVVYQNSTPIPEPGTGLLLGIGLAAIAARRSRR